MTNKPLIIAGILLGVGMGGFIDGIVFHQILQAHNMLSNKLFPDTLVNLEINMFWDGLFHLFTWIITFIGILRLWLVKADRSVPRSTTTLLGSMLLGWGLFNFIEGLIDHQLLQIHHVIQRAGPSEQLVYDLIFLGIGLLQILSGYIVAVSRKNNSIV
ncbi:MAG TPA: DUF2243 domain-containing protein [Bacteriovoracaceae bacterium]|nr:DUF2243 domain-containing protein [Bacteriovoracaceae bacterium]